MRVWYQNFYNLQNFRLLLESNHSHNEIRKEAPWEADLVCRFKGSVRLCRGRTREQKVSQEPCGIKRSRFLTLEDVERLRQTRRRRQQRALKKRFLSMTKEEQKRFLELRRKRREHAYLLKLSKTHSLRP